MWFRRQRVTSVCHRWRLFNLCLCCCRWSSWELCAEMLWTTVTSQKTARATPARWAWAPPPHWSSKLNAGPRSTSKFEVCFVFCSVHPTCTKWMATRVKKTRWDVQLMLISCGVIFLKKAKQRLQFSRMSPDRGAASMDGAKPKTDSANTFGEKVSANGNCTDRSERASAGVTLNVLCVALRGNRGWKVLLREAEHRRDGERKLRQGQGHLDPV